MEEKLNFKGIGIEITGTREMLKELVSCISYGDNEPSNALADFISTIEMTLSLIELEVDE